MGTSEKIATGGPGSVSVSPFLKKKSASCYICSQNTRQFIGKKKSSPPIISVITLGCFLRSKTHGWCCRPRALLVNSKRIWMLSVNSQPQHDLTYLFLVLFAPCMENENKKGMFTYSFHLKVAWEPSLWVGLLCRLSLDGYGVQGGPRLLLRTQCSWYK